MIYIVKTIKIIYIVKNAQNEIKEKFSIFFCPQILTILLTDLDNCIFNLEDELDLKQYVENNNEKNEGIYKLISILCQFKNDSKFRTYFINIFDTS